MLVIATIKVVALSHMGIRHASYNGKQIARPIYDCNPLIDGVIDLTITKLMRI